MPPLTLRGTVVRVGLMNKTATVAVTRHVLHPRSGKRLEQTKKYQTHDEDNKLKKEDYVLIRNCPPVSATKRFTLDRILRSPETERAARRAQEAVLESAATLRTNPPSPGTNP
jgi:small subunit ribosomal protein S17